MRALTEEQNRIHQLALNCARQQRKTESDLVQILQRVDELKIYKALEKNSLFGYATELLGLDKNIAYALITVARKAREIPAVASAIKAEALPISKMSRIVSTLNIENASEWIDFAAKHSRDEIDFELAKKNPKALIRDKMRHLSESLVEIKRTMTLETFEKLKRAESLQAQKGRGTKWNEVMDACLEGYLDKNDPVRKAMRAEKKKTSVDLQLLHARVESKSSGGYERIPLTAEEKHAVFLRDQGRCTHVDLTGKRCNQDRWVDIHHIISVSQGGTNALKNLTTLCSFHHDLAHQMALPIEGQVTWLRSPQVRYG